MDKIKSLLIAVQQKSPATKRKVGAVITYDDGEVLATGYNQSLIGLECDTYINSEHITFGHVTHAEEAAIMQVLTDPDREVGNHALTITCSYSPCYNCMRLIVQSKLFHTLIITDKHPVDFDMERLNGNLSPLAFALRSGLTVEHHHHPKGTITIYSPDKK